MRWVLNEKLLQILRLSEQHHADGGSFRTFAGSTEPGWRSGRRVEELAAAEPGA